MRKSWWQEWVQIQLEIDLVHYWLAEIEASVALQNRIQPLVEQSGTLAQQAAFFQRRSQLEFRRDTALPTMPPSSISSAPLTFTNRLVC